MSVVDSLPDAMRELFSEVIGVEDPGLLTALGLTEEASEEQRVRVEGILSKEFTRCLGQDYEPTDRGKAVDDLLGAFLLRWPIGP